MAIVEEEAVVVDVIAVYLEAMEEKGKVKVRRQRNSRRQVERPVTRRLIKLGPDFGKSKRPMRI